jgi:hypothetical protein
MTNTSPEIHLAGTTLQTHRHICAFFHNQDEEYQVMLPFIKEGLERGERACHIVNPQLQQDHHYRLDKAGIDAVDLTQKKQLDVRIWDQAYLRNGNFDQNAMLTLIEEILSSAKNDGFSLTRLVAHMEWALSEKPGVQDLMEYESRLNYILPQYDDPVICVYDLGKFSAGTIIDILRTHPMVILGGILQVNPFYISPDEFLKELRNRAKRVS